MPSRIVNVLSAASAHPWALRRETLDALVNVLCVRGAGASMSPTEVQAAITARHAAAAAREPKPTSPGAVGILPIYGVIAHRLDMMSEMSGGVSTDRVAREFDAQMADPNVVAIVLDIDSPGGSVGGVAELADRIHAARGTKPIVAVANTLAASAAYWLAAQADEVVATPSALVGSIGVYGVHFDISKAMEMEGVVPTIISAGKYKVEGSELSPLTDEARAAEQSLVDEFYGMFTKAVARGRGVSATAVRGGFGEGRVVPAGQAVSLGMADRVATLEETVARLGTPAGRKRAMSRSADTLRRDLALAEDGL